MVAPDGKMIVVKGVSVLVKDNLRFVSLLTLMLLYGG